MAATLPPWVPLFDVQVRHEFYAPGPCQGLSLTPTPESLRRLARVGAVLRPTAAGCAAFVPGDRLPMLQAMAGDDIDPLLFDLIGRSRDLDFAGATTGLSAEGRTLMLCSLRAQPPQEDGWQLLHAGPLADAGAGESVPTLPLLQSLPAAERRMPPLFVLRLHVEPGDGTPQDWAAQALGRRWRVAFGARRTFWKYLLPPEWAPQQPQVVDTAGLTGFYPPASEELVDGRTALAVRSRSAIALTRRPAQHFQVLAGAPRADKVLVRRLPVASAGQFGKAEIDGVQTLVSEIPVVR
jgi:hypothetical protein